MAHRLFLVEDHPIVRYGLVSLLEAEADLTVCGETDSAQEARRRIPEVKPDLAIVDLFLVDGSGLALIKDLSAHSSLPILVLSAHAETLYAHRVLAAGARGYLMKSEAYWKIVEAARQLLDGNIYLSPDMTSAMLNAYMGDGPAPTNDPIETLSDRELEVFTLMGRGLSRRNMAEALSLSPKTIDTYREHLKRKLSLDTNEQLRRNAAVWVALDESTDGRPRAQ